MTSEKLPPPYRGIQPYRYVDGDFYFGREELVDELTAKIVLYRLVILFGESGVGKSSLINAGLIPALLAKGFQPERLRLRPFGPQPISVERVSGGTGKDDEFLESIFAPGASQAATVSRIDKSLEDFDATIKNASYQAPIVLIFDQFEELFTLFAQKDSHALLEKLQQQILAMIVDLIRNARLKVKIIIVIREDYLARLDVLAKHYPQVFDHRVLLEQLDKDDAAKAVLCPFRSIEFPSRLTAKLAVTIIKELSATRLDGCIHPTELQIVCRRLWDNFAHETPAIGTLQFKQMGGTKGIIEGFLTSELDAIAPELKDNAVGILSNLITDAGTRDVVSSQKLTEVMEDLGDKALLKDALDVLEYRRLINSISERGILFYELSSEFLIGPIQKERDQFALQQARKRERMEVNKRVRIGALLAVVILIFVAVLGYERLKARERAEQLEQQRQEAIKIAGVESGKNLQTRTLISNLSALVDSEKAKRQVARDNIVRDAETNEIPLAIIPLIEDLVRRKDPELADSYLTALSQTILKTPPSVNVEPAANPVRVYIQFSGDIQRGLARQIKSGLEHEGMVVGIRRVSHGPRNSELRYFISTDKDVATQVALKVRQLGLSDAQAVYVSGYENSTLVKPLQYELWFEGLPQPIPSPEPVGSPDFGGPSLGTMQKAWFVSIFPESPSLVQRLVVSSLLEAVAAMDGVSPRLYANGVKLGPYNERELAERARQRTIEALSGTKIKLKAEPSLTYIPVLK